MERRRRSRRMLETRSQQRGKISKEKEENHRGGLKSRRIAKEKNLLF
jgi:hypothetical protein